MKKQWSSNIESSTIKNNLWRKVMHTSDHLQVVLMCVPVGESLDWEMHSKNDQFIRIEKGNGILITKNSKHSTKISKTILKEGIATIIPQGLYHNVINTSKTNKLKFYTIYGPPHHPIGTIDRTHADEIKRENS